MQQGCLWGKDLPWAYYIAHSAYENEAIKRLYCRSQARKFTLRVVSGSGYETSTQWRRPFLSIKEGRTWGAGLSTGISPYETSSIRVGDI